MLGGGVVPGSLTLVGGEPGVGKSTLLLQMAAMLTEASLLEPGYSGSSGSSKDAKGSAGAAAAAAAASGKGGGKRKQDVQQPAAAGEQQEAEADAAAAAAASDEEDGSSVGDAPGGGLTVLYVSAEESVEQVGSRAERMGIARNPSIYIYSGGWVIGRVQAVGGRGCRAGFRALHPPCCQPARSCTASPHHARPRKPSPYLHAHALTQPTLSQPAGLDSGRDHPPAAGRCDCGLHPDGLPG